MSKQLIAIAGVIAVAGMGLAWLRQPAKTPAGMFQASSTGPIAWRINTATGAVSMCRGGGFGQAPVCSPWGARNLEQERVEREVD